VNTFGIQCIKVPYPQKRPFKVKLYAQENK